VGGAARRATPPTHPLQTDATWVIPNFSNLCSKNEGAGSGASLPGFGVTPIGADLRMVELKKERRKRKGKKVAKESQM
jgi:hypothetical protein